MMKMKLILTSLLLMSMNSYAFAETLSPAGTTTPAPTTGDDVNVTVTPESNKVIVNTPRKPAHCVDGCSQAEDCRNNEHQAKEGYMWQCNHDVLKRGGCDGTCEQIPVPSPDSVSVSE